VIDVAERLPRADAAEARILVRADPDQTRHRQWLRSIEMSSAFFLPE
jgi:hypothetical protein